MRGERRGSAAAAVAAAATASCRPGAQTIRSKLVARRAPSVHSCPRWHRQRKAGWRRTAQSCWVRPQAPAWAINQSQVQASATSPATCRPPATRRPAGSIRSTGSGALPPSMHVTLACGWGGGCSSGGRQATTHRICAPTINCSCTHRIGNVLRDGHDCGSNTGQKVGLRCGNRWRATILGCTRCRPPHAQQGSCCC